MFIVADLVSLNGTTERATKRVSGIKNTRLLHDNAPTHKGGIVTEFLQQENVTVLPHPPSSLDLAPCDFFSRLKKLLAGGKISRRCLWDLQCSSV